MSRAIVYTSLHLSSVTYPQEPDASKLDLDCYWKETTLGRKDVVCRIEGVTLYLTQAQAERIARALLSVNQQAQESEMNEQYTPFPFVHDMQHEPHL